MATVHQLLAVAGAAETLQRLAAASETAYSRANLEDIFAHELILRKQS